MKMHGTADPVRNVQTQKQQLLQLTGIRKAGRPGRQVSPSTRSYLVPNSQINSKEEPRQLSYHTDKKGCRVSPGERDRAMHIAHFLFCASILQPSGIFLSLIIQQVVSCFIKINFLKN